MKFGTGVVLSTVLLMGELGFSNGAIGIGTVKVVTGLVIAGTETGIGVDRSSLYDRLRDEEIMIFNELSPTEKERMVGEMKKVSLGSLAIWEEDSHEPRRWVVCLTKSDRCIHFMDLRGDGVRSRDLLKNLYEE